MNIAKYVTIKNAVYFIFFTICLCLLGQISFSLIRHSDHAVNAFIGLSMIKDGLGADNWFFGTSSFYFTDLLYHGLVAIFTSNPHTITSISPFFIMIPLFICSYMICERVVPSSKISLWLCVLMFVIFLYETDYRFLRSPNHTGTVAFCLIALLTFYNDNKYNILSKIFFVAFTAMAIDSDKYALFYLILPLLTQSVVSWWQTKKIDYNLLWLVPVILLILLYNLTIGYQVPGIGQQKFVEAEQLSSHFYYWFFGFFKIFNAWIWGAPIAVTTLPIFIAVILLMALLLSHIVSICLFKLNNKYINFFVFSSFFLSCGFIFSNIGNGFDVGRYLVPILFNGTILLVIVLSKILVNNAKTISMICMAATLVLLIYDARSQTIKYHTFIQNNSVVKLIESENLKSGYASFWDSYANGILFPDVQILPVKYDGKKITPHFWLSPKQYITKADFILIGPDKKYGITIEAVELFFGKPQKVITKGDYSILKYDYDLSSRFDESLFYGRELPNGIEVVENADKSVTNKTTSKSGFLTYGPYVSKPKGTYEIVVNYELSDDGKAWFDVVADAGKISLLKKQLETNKTRSSEKVLLKSDIQKLEVRVYYGGVGKLTVKSIEINEK